LLSEAWESSRRFVVTGGIGQGKRAITKNIMADLIVGELCTEALIESHSGGWMLDVTSSQVSKIHKTDMKREIPKKVAPIISVAILQVSRN